MNRLWLIAFGLTIGFSTVSLAEDAPISVIAQMDPRLEGTYQLEQHGIELYQQGRYEEASRIAEDVLGVREFILGNHPDTATALNNLALVYESQGRYSEVEVLYKRSLYINEQFYGYYHPDTASAYNNLAVFYESQERYSEADSLYRTALTIAVITLGAEHPTTILFQNNSEALIKQRF